MLVEFFLILFYIFSPYFPEFELLKFISFKRDLTVYLSCRICWFLHKYFVKACPALAELVEEALNCWWEIWKHLSIFVVLAYRIDDNSVFKEAKLTASPIANIQFSWFWFHCFSTSEHFCFHTRWRKRDATALTWIFKRKPYSSKCLGSLLAKACLMLFTVTVREVSDKENGKKSW